MLKIKEMTLEEFYNKDKNIFNLTYQNLEEEEMEDRYKRELERAREFYYQMIEFCRDELNVFFLEDIVLIGKVIDFSNALATFCTNKKIPEQFLHLLFDDDINRIKKEGRK